MTKTYNIHQYYGNISTQPVGKMRVNLDTMRASRYQVRKLNNLALPGSTCFLMRGSIKLDCDQSGRFYY